MIDRKQLDDYSQRFRSTGLTYAYHERDGSGNVTKLIEIPWEQAIMLILQKTGWTVFDRGEEATPEPVTRGHLTRIK